jgi:general secretion pathway protein J
LTFSNPTPYPLPELGRRNGYTLIEVLVAMVIFTAMLMLAGMALNQGLMQYQGLVERGLNFWDYAKNIWIDKSFNSASDYYVHTRSDGWFPYFRGGQDSVSYVSLAPFAGELPVVVWIRSEDDAKGKHSLVYYELPVYTKTYEEIDRDFVFGEYKKGKSFKLLEGVEGVEISFYGYDFAHGMHQWFNGFEGNKMQILPSLVKISYAGESGRSSLVFGINVNSLLKRRYNEEYPR